MPLIVIIDDRATNCKIFGRLAKSIEPDIQVETFDDPAEALAWTADRMPDLVITDYKMPHMNGAEFIKRFRELPGAADVPVVVITVYEERSFRLKALEAGATDFLNSPVDHPEFVTRARNLLNLRKHQLLLANRAGVLERELADSEHSREMALRDSRERLAQVIDTVPLVINAVDRDGRLLFVNAYGSELLGKPEDGVVTPARAALLGELAMHRSLLLDRMVFETGKPLPSYEEEVQDRDGNDRIFLTTKAPLKDSSGIVTGILTTSLDITSRKRDEAHLRYLADHDTLTGLPNRAKLQERVRALIARSRRADVHFALHLIDLDGFKAINDVLGHSAGDRYLKGLSAHLTHALPDIELIARLGGDEFAVLQADVGSLGEAAMMARRLSEIVSGFVNVEDRRLGTGASIGTALYPTDGLDGEELLKNADLAMYKAKSEGGQSCCFYASDLETEANSTVTLDAELRDAIAKEQFVLHYQPQIDLSTGRIVGAEALLRWQRPGVGLTSPGVFLARAEENGLILPISEWVLHEACREARRWQVAGLALRVSVNMSAKQFSRRTVPLMVAQTLAETGLDPRRLELELTENIVMQDIDATAHDLQQLVDLGVHIAIDDFGTGYSSFGYVKKFPVDRIKIDQSFIRNMASDENDAAIVRAIVTLARSLDIAVIAEGVETADQLALVRSEGCNEVQGFYFGAPMPATEFLALVGRESSLARIA